jgi:hypothetical protein
VRALGRVAVLGEGNEDDDDDADLTADGKFVAFDAKSSAATEVASGASAYVVTLGGENWQIDGVGAPPYGAGR